MSRCCVEGGNGHEIRRNTGGRGIVVPATYYLVSTVRPAGPPARRRNKIQRSISLTISLPGNCGVRGSRFSGEYRGEYTLIVKLIFVITVSENLSRRALATRSSISSTSPSINDPCRMCITQRHTHDVMNHDKCARLG